MDLRSILALATVCVSPVAIADELIDVDAALRAGFTVVSSRAPRSSGSVAHMRNIGLRNDGGVRLFVQAAQQLALSTPDRRWERFWDAVQNPPKVIPEHRGEARLGDRSYSFYRQGVSGWRIYSTLRMASVDVVLGLAERREGRRIFYEPNEAEADWLVMHQVAARTLANIASRELSGISDDPSTGAGRHARPDGARFVELAPWARAKGWSARLNDDGISVTLAKGERTVVVNLASKDATVDGAKRTLSECPLWKGGRFLVAEKDLAKMLL